MGRHYKPAESPEADLQHAATLLQAGCELLHVELSAVRTGGATVDEVQALVKLLYHRSVILNDEICDLLFLSDSRFNELMFKRQPGTGVDPHFEVNAVMWARGRQHQVAS